MQRIGLTYGEAGAGGPDAVALAVEDGGFVDIAGADEAVSEDSISVCNSFHTPRCSPSQGMSYL